MTTSELDTILWSKIRRRMDRERRELADYCMRQPALTASEAAVILDTQMRHAQLDAEEAEAAKKFLASQTE